MKTKKSLGQHFLIDSTVIEQIIAHIGDLTRFETVLEIGPGMGILTEQLISTRPQHFKVVEIDDRFVEHLKHTYPFLRDKIIHQNVLHLSFEKLVKNRLGIVGNFPYNISSQIVFKIIENKDLVIEMIGMFQKEVAKRIVSDSGSKTYGILSVLTQVYYSTTYLLDVPPSSFSPPPKVHSGVIRLKRKEEWTVDFNQALLKRIVKLAFNQRRKTLRNSLKSLSLLPQTYSKTIFDKRPEQISVNQFVALTKTISKDLKNRP